MANDNSVVVKVGDKVFIKGDQGYVFIPSVDAESNISWTNDGGLPNPEPRNIRGKSAYAQAVEGGYPGTENEFNTDLASFKTYTETAVEAKDVAVAAKNSAVAAKNAAASSATSASTYADNASTSATQSASSASAASTSATAAATAKTGAETAQAAAELAQEKAEEAAEDVSSKAGVLRDTVSGAIASFTPDSTINNLLGVTVGIEAIQAGSGDPSPDNVRPISGWDAVEVETSCANIWDEQWVTGSIDSNGADIASSNGIRSANYCRCAGDTQYSFVKSAGITARVYWYGETKNFISRSVAQREGSQEVITSPVNAYWYRIQVGDASYRYPTYNNDIALLYPATETEYRAHVGNTYTITIGQTAYGGTLDVTNGKMTVDRAKITLTASDASLVTRNSAFQYYVKLSATPGIVVPGSIQEDIISNLFKPIYGTNTRGNVFHNSDGTIRFNTVGDYATVAEMLTDLASIEFVYPITPLEIQLDPVAIATIANQTNNVWADAGDVSVEFAADIKAYIDRMNQPTEDDMIANSLIASGKYFTINNKLYLSTASIAAGAQIIPGHNCTETSLAEALNALNA